MIIVGLSINEWCPHPTFLFPMWVSISWYGRTQRTLRCDINTNHTFDYLFLSKVRKFILWIDRLADISCLLIMLFFISLKLVSTLQMFRVTLVVGGRQRFVFLPQWYCKKSSCHLLVSCFECTMRLVVLNFPVFCVTTEKLCMTTFIFSCNVFLRL